DRLPETDVAGNRQGILALQQLPSRQRPPQRTAHERTANPHRTAARRGISRFGPRTNSAVNVRVRLAPDWQAKSNLQSSPGLIHSLKQNVLRTKKKQAGV